MVYALLLSGYIPPSSGFLYFLLVSLSLVAVLGIWLLVLGLHHLRQDKESLRGYWLIVGSFALPALGYAFLANLL